MSLNITTGADSVSVPCLGLVQLEALEMLSNQAEGRVHSLLSTFKPTGPELEAIKAELVYLRDVFELKDVDAEEEEGRSWEEEGRSRVRVARSLCEHFLSSSLRTVDGKNPSVTGEIQKRSSSLSDLKTKLSPKKVLPKS